MLVYAMLFASSVVFLIGSASTFVILRRAARGRSRWLLALALLGPPALPVVLGVLQGARRGVPRGLLRATAVSAVSLGVGLLLLSAMRVAFVHELSARKAGLARRRSEVDARLRAGRWERPSLGGEPLEGNAAVAQHEALAPFVPLPRRSALEDLSAEEVGKLAARHSEALARLRAATRRSWAWSLGAPGNAASDAPHLAKAAVLIEAAAMEGCTPRSEDGDSLRAAVDVALLAQDASAGGGALELVVGAGLLSRVAGIVNMCALRTPLEHVRAARDDLRALAQLSTHEGHAFAAELAWNARAATSVGGASDDFGSWLDLSWIAADEALAAAAAYLDAVPSVEGLTAASYPEPIRRLRSLSRTWSRSLNPFLRRTARSFDMAACAESDARGQAWLRLAVPHLDAVVLRATSGEFTAAPPPSIYAPELRDPFTGAPFGWTRTPKGWIRLSSFGKNGKDDAGDPNGDDIGVVLGVKPPPLH